MKRATYLLSLVMIVFLAACAPASPSNPGSSPSTAPNSAPTTAPTTAPAAPPTDAPTTAPAASPTVAPTEAGPCTDKASFVDDVTAPDYSHFDQRAAFTKTWRVKNVGTCTWTPDYQAKYSHGDALGNTMSVPLSNTAPQATLDISVDMQAPARDGKFETFFQLVNAAGDPMPVDDGGSVWALITVGKFVASAPATAVPPAIPVSSGSTGAGLGTATCVTQSNTDFLNQLVNLVNAARTSNGLPALTVNDKLSTAAQSHSADMACNNFLAHIGWNGSTPDSRVAAAGYAASIARENIYAQPPQFGGTPQVAVDWWMGDQSHRDAILNPAVTELGVGYASYSRSDLVGYFTIDLAAP